MTQVPSEEVILLPLEGCRESLDTTCQEARPLRWKEIPGKTAFNVPYNSNVSGSQNLTHSICDGFLAFPRLLPNPLPPLYWPWITRFTRHGKQIHPGSPPPSVIRANKAIEGEIRSSTSNRWLQTDCFFSPSLTLLSSSFLVLLFSLFHSLPVSFSFVLLISYIPFLQFFTAFLFCFSIFSLFSISPISVFLFNW